MAWYVLFIILSFGGIGINLVGRRLMAQEKSQIERIGIERGASPNVRGFVSGPEPQGNNSSAGAMHRVMASEYAWPNNAVSIVSEQGLSIGSGETQGDFNTRMAAKFQDAQRLLDSHTGYLKEIR